MDDTTYFGPRIAVGTHYRVWWFWLPLLFGGVGLLCSAVLLPIFPRIGVMVDGAAVVCLLTAAAAGVMIERGRRWVELSDDGFRLSDLNTQTEIADEQVTDLALDRKPHHGAGRLLAETRQLLIWITSDDTHQRLTLTSRMAPGAADPLQPLINRLRQRLGDQAKGKLLNGEMVEGDGWAIDGTHLHLVDPHRPTTIALDELSAVEVIGQEVRLWQRDDLYAIARLPISGRNGWLLERLLSQRVAHRSTDSSHRRDPRDRVLSDEAPRPSPLGRILFERSPGVGPTVMFGVLGLLLANVGGISLWIGVQRRDPVMSAVGGTLCLFSILCFAGGLRMQRVRFRCYERGLERITMTTRKVLRFDEMDVFSFENRRNQSQGRYTGTTYTLVFADRSREQGRGIFYSTNVRNHDDELDDLRQRVAQIIARRMAQTFAAHRSVQWTPEVWFRHDALEYVRRRRMFVPAKSALIPYDTITDFELRDGLLHIWTTYQDRAVLSLNAAAPNFYPGLIVLEGLVRAWEQSPNTTAV